MVVRLIGPSPTSFYKKYLRVCLQFAKSTLNLQENLTTKMKAFLVAPTVGGLAMYSTRAGPCCFTRAHQVRASASIFVRPGSPCAFHRSDRFMPRFASMFSKSSSTDGKDTNRPAAFNDEDKENRTGGSSIESAPFGTSYHTPVMWKQCIDALLECSRSQSRVHGVGDENDDARREPLIFVDGTLGGGGHSAALLEHLSPGDIVLGCDVDPKALETASRRLKDYMVGNSSEDQEVVTDASDISHPIFIPGKSIVFCLERRESPFLASPTEFPSSS